MADYKRVLAAIHRITVTRGWQDVEIDLRQCSAAFAGPVLALAATARRLEGGGIDVTVTPPADQTLNRLFRNAGWLHAFNPAESAPQPHVGSPHVPAISFHTEQERHTAVNRTLDTILASLPGLAREDLNALEWAVNETTENVLSHSESAFGGFVQLSAFTSRRQVEMVVADGGIGIPATIRQRFPGTFPDSRAVDLAIQEGVTHLPQQHQGNGLFGTVEIARVTKGYVRIHSGYAHLAYEGDRLLLDDDKIPLNGTLVVACLDCSDPGALGRALRFDGVQHHGLDVVDMRYTSDDLTSIVFVVKRDSASLGSREAGAGFRTKIENLMGMRPQDPVVLDFSGVTIMSSSFADEVVGKLFRAMGPLAFMARVRLQGLTPTVRGLLDRAITQRAGSE
jgi:anti-sigma regulatory factor (Ser/Thr protein kinase)